MSGKIWAWVHLLRPWSYVATVVPFVVAASVFGVFGGADWLHWWLGLLVGILFQATVNLLNTWGDERSGVDDAPGAMRTTPQVHDGLVSLREVFAAAVACAAVASAGGLALCAYKVDGAADGAAWSMNKALLVAGIVGFFGATNYSTGIKFKYRGLGVPFVSLLMGPLEILVAGTLLLPEMYVLFASSIEFCALFALWSLPVAALVGVIMHGNDMRDIPSDRAAGIVTLASRLGPKGALAYYRFCHLLPYAVCVALAVLSSWFFRWSPRGAVFLLPTLCLPLSVGTLRAAGAAYGENPDCPRWRRLERASGGIHLVFGLLYALSAALFFLIPGE